MPDGFAMGVVSRARDLGCLVGVVGDLKYVSSIAEGRASGEDTRRYVGLNHISLEALFSTVLDGDPQSLPYLISKSKK